MVALRHPRTYTSIRAWVVAPPSRAIGLSAQVGVIGLARRHPLLDMDDPSSGSRFHDYVSLKQFGGGPLGPIGVFPLPLGILGILGIVALWRAQRRLAVGLLALYTMSSLGTVIYFNMRSPFSWPMDRHDLPSFVIFAVFVALGATVAARWVDRIRTTRGPQGRALAGAAARAILH